MLGKVLNWFRKSGLHPFPLYQTLRNYTVGKALADFRAGINVSLLDFPQGMAYALIAGLPVQMGIFCSALSSITGPFLASSRFVMLGPTNATAVMLLSTFLTLGYAPEQAVIALPMMLILVGVFMVAGAFIGVASITQYISRAVVVGYITAAACLIIVNQLKTVLGLHVPRAGTFAESLQNLIIGIGETQWEALTMASLTLLVYLPLKRWAKGLPTVALTLLIAGGLAVVLGHYGVHAEMLSPISVSSWTFGLPRFDLGDLAVIANGALAVAFLSLLESSSIAKTLAAQSGDRVDLNQQMLSMGAANFACAFGGGMAVSGSLTRSVLNFRSGAQTAISSIFSGVLLVAGLFLFGRFIGYIPKPALAMLVILVGLSLINRTTIWVMLKTTRSDATVFLSTFIGGLFLPLDTAIYLGAAASIGLFLHKASKPGLKEVSFDDSGKLVEQKLERERKDRPEIAIVHVEGDLFFASSDVFLDQMRHVVQHPALSVIILRLRNAHNLDASVALTIKDLVLFARSNGRDVIVSGAHPYVERVFKNSGLLETLGESNFFRYHPENPTISTRDALKRAQEITGEKSADITIFASEKKGD
ncbi:SulP family inorganic anion transporter [Coraliomargarita sp. SDUM461004]|uniref:SulP family inorganic anion transporter n=1 Tax=Thalassobacterium sedimentorum TaxID=3041258 RepID=A0ABU1AFF3_9BACT|nr:SulP family inorganic anion transporter [Coraliomargarita sp. SDUM461004]MDQ8193541.1 SulP family inorganic anion transporter [Coraliomargarita sp. SDUM461004]